MSSVRSIKLVYRGGKAGFNSTFSKKNLFYEIKAVARVPNIRVKSPLSLPFRVKGVKRRMRAMSWIIKFCMKPGWMIAIPEDSCVVVASALPSPVFGASVVVVSKNGQNGNLASIFEALKYIREIMARMRIQLSAVYCRAL